MILRTAIEREGYRCVEAADGMAALKLFQEKTIDFIITDFQMPHMNGCEFLEVLSSAASSSPPAVKHSKLRFVLCLPRCGGRAGTMNTPIT
ncbi:MAG: response regulator [Nitrospirales bacterium]|nr:response regulator [Nitrospirales bacterium]